MHQRQKPLLETLALGVLRSTALHGRNPEIPLSLVDSSPALCRDLNTKASWVRHWQSRDTQPGPLGQIQPRVVHFALNVVVRPLQRKKLTEHQVGSVSCIEPDLLCRLERGHVGYMRVMSSKLRWEDRHNVPPSGVVLRRLSSYFTLLLLYRAQER